MMTKIFYAKGYVVVITSDFKLVIISDFNKIRKG